MAPQGHIMAGHLSPAVLKRSATSWWRSTMSWPPNLKLIHKTLIYTLSGCCTLSLYVCTFIMLWASIFCFLVFFFTFNLNFYLSCMCMCKLDTPFVFSLCWKICVSKCDIILSKRFWNMLREKGLRILRNKDRIWDSCILLVSGKVSYVKCFNGDTFYIKP